MITLEVSNHIVERNRTWLVIGYNYITDIIAQQCTMWFMVWCDSVVDDLPAYTMVGNTYAIVDDTTELPCFAWVDATDTVIGDSGYKMARGLAVMDATDTTVSPDIVWGSTEFGVLENKPIGGSIGIIGTGQPGFIYSIPEHEADDSYVYIHPTSGKIRLQRELDFELRDSIRFAVHANGMDGVIVTTVCVIRVLDVNEAPIAGDGEPVVRNVNVATEVGSIVYTVGAADVDAGDVFAYHIEGGTGAEYFDIDSVSGSVHVIAPLTGLDVGVYTLQVVVTDTGGLTCTVDVRIHLTAAVEQAKFNVILISFGGKKIQVIKEIRDLTGLALQEAKDMVDLAGPQCIVLTDVTEDDANSAKEELEIAGASVDIVPI